MSDTKSLKTVDVTKITDAVRTPNTAKDFYGKLGAGFESETKLNTTEAKQGQIMSTLRAAAAENFPRFVNLTILAQGPEKANGVLVMDGYESFTRTTVTIEKTITVPTLDEIIQELGDGKSNNPGLFAKMSAYLKDLHSASKRTVASNAEHLAGRMAKDGKLVTEIKSITNQAIQQGKDQAWGKEFLRVTEKMLFSPPKIFPNDLVKFCKVADANCWEGDTPEQQSAAQNTSVTFALATEIIMENMDRWRQKYSKASEFHQTLWKPRLAMANRVFVIRDLVFWDSMSRYTNAVYGTPASDMPLLKGLCNRITFEPDERKAIEQSPRSRDGECRYGTKCNRINVRNNKCTRKHTKEPSTLPCPYQVCRGDGCQYIHKTVTKIDIEE